MILRQTVALVISGSLLLTTVPAGLAQQPDQPSSTAAGSSANESPEQLQQLVAPIALYPDALVAQILAAATYPAEIVEAERWIQAHSDLNGKKLADEVNKQRWDLSVKALTQFPSVLANMDKNLSWTSSLGDAYVNEPQDVMNAVQAMRADAEHAGNLKSTPQEKVTNKGSTIVIEPAASNVVYVPEYDPWIVYGMPLAVWPDWYAYPGLYIAGPGIAFGLGFSLGFFGGFAWGWPHWGFDWAHRTVVFNHNTYISHSRTFANRRAFVNRNSFASRAFASHDFAGHNDVAHHNNSSRGHSAFSGFNHGGIASGFASRGRASFGGGFHGGGFHGGGSHGGGGRR